MRALDQKLKYYFTLEIFTQFTHFSNRNSTLKRFKDILKNLKQEKEALENSGPFQLVHIYTSKNDFNI